MHIAYYIAMYIYILHGKGGNEIALYFHSPSSHVPFHIYIVENMEFNSSYNFLQEYTKCYSQ